MLPGGCPRVTHALGALTETAHHVALWVRTYPELRGSPRSRATLDYWYAVMVAAPMRWVASPDVVTELPCHDFVDPDARNEWIVLSDLFCIINALGVDDRVAGDGFHPHG